MTMWQHECDLIDRALQGEINAKRKNGVTALMTATKWGMVEAVRTLVDLGADIHAQDKYGFMALSLAVLHGRVALAKLFLQHGAQWEPGTEAECLRQTAQNSAEIACRRSREAQNQWHEDYYRDHPELRAEDEALLASCGVQACETDVLLRKQGLISQVLAFIALIYSGISSIARNVGGKLLYFVHTPRNR